jgi:integrase
VSHAKNHLEHTFPAGAMAIQLIAAQIAADRRESKFLFPSRTSIERPFNGWSKCKKEVDKVAKIEPWTLHDLRRTFRTNLGRLKVRPDIAERLVNHISARTEMEETHDLYTRNAGGDGEVGGVCAEHLYQLSQTSGLAPKTIVISRVRLLSGCRFDVTLDVQQ